MKTLCSLIRGILYIALFLLWGGIALALPQLAGWVTEPNIWSILAPIIVWSVLLWPFSKLWSAVDRYVRPKEGRLSKAWQKRQELAGEKNLVRKTRLVVKEMGEGDIYEGQYKKTEFRIVPNRRYEGITGTRSIGSRGYGYEVIWDDEVVFHGLYKPKSTTPKGPDQLKPDGEGGYEVREGTRQTTSARDRIKVYHRGPWEEYLEQLYQQAVNQQDKRKQAEEEATPSYAEKLKQKLGE